MDEAKSALNAVIVAHFVDPAQKCAASKLDAALNAFDKDSVWLARAQIVRHILDPHKTSAQEKDDILQFYAKYAEAGDALACIEAARACAVFEEPDQLLQHLEKAESLLGLSPRVEGISVMFTPNQTKPTMRVACLAEPSSTPAASEGVKPIDMVRLHSNEERFEPPKFTSTEEERLSTSLLADVDYLVLLLHAAHTTLSNPASTTTVVNEQALPFIRRITETADFQSINFAIKERALYERSILEMKDINELERGTVQLGKVSKAVHEGPDVARALEYFHMIVPLAWRSVDEMAARRFVAMSDFANAIPFYRHLEQPLDVAICLTATGATAEAAQILEAPELANNPEALMLRADLSSDAAQWEQVWDRFRSPKAKFRLAQKSLADKQPEQCLSHVQDLLTVQPSHHDALKLAGSTALSLERWEDAVTYLRRSLALNEDDRRGWSDLATALLQSEQPQAAHHAIKQAMRVSQNSEPDIPTYTNFVALSAQLGLYDDVLVGLIQLADAGERGSASYVAKVSGVLPRLVSNNLKQPYTGSTSQKQLVDLFANKLPKVISEDDPMLCRFTGLVQIWAKDYQKGLAALNRAVDLLFADLSSADERIAARVRLYTGELIENLERYGDAPGRFEGSQAFPGWQARKEALERKLSSLGSQRA